jgi:nucleotide-binding universal stress UspA family protein
MTTFAYWRPASPGQGQAQQPEWRALEAFGVAHGLTLERRMEPDQARPTKMSERTAGGPLLRTLQAGDTLLVPSVAAAFDLPSDLLEVARKVAGRGAVLRVVTWAAHSGPLELAAELAGVFTPLEAELARLRDELSVVQADAEARMLETTREVIKTLGDRFGAFTKDLPTLGDVREGRPEQHAGEHVGTAMQRRAEKLGLTQSELSRRTGVPQASISRAFSSGTGGAIETLAKALWPQAEPEKADSRTPGSGSGAALAAAGFGFGMGG